MRWPPWSSSNSSEDESIHATEKKKEKKKNAAISWNNSLNAIDWAHYTEPRNLTAVALLTATTLALVHLWRSRLRRIPGAGSIQPNFFRKRSLFGTVTSVGDGDGFRLFHTPGGRLTGWGWIPGRKVPEKRDDLRDRTISVRLAGIDAPEMAHFGRPAQPYSNEAYNWLRDYISGRRVRAYIYKRDQYDRVVATVYVRRGLLRRDVGLQMLKHGLATVYEAKSGAEFGVLENKYRSAEWWAQKRRKGMWGSKSALESPREYKTRVGKEEAGKT